MKQVVLLCVGLLPVCVALAAEAPAPSDPASAMKREIAKLAVNAPLKDALTQFEKLAGVKIEADWAALAAAGVKPDAKVTLSLTSITGEKALDLMLNQVAAKNAPLAWYVDRDIIRISTQMRALYRNRVAEAISSSARPQPKVAAPAAREFNFDNIPLEDVLNFFKDLSGVNFHVNWKSLELVNIDRKTPITLKASNISVARAMDLVLDDIGAGKSKYDRVYWVINDAVVEIATGTVLDKDLKTKVYDVTDLLMVVPNFVGPRINLAVAGSPNSTGSNTTSSNSNTSGNNSFWGTNNTNTGNAGSGSNSASGTEETNIVEERQKLRDNLIGAVKESVGSDMWQPEGKGSIRLLGNKLLISQTLLGFKLMEEASGRK